MSSLQAEFVTDFHELETLAEDWDRLWSADPQRSIFGCFGWARASWNAYGSQRKLCAVVLRDDGQVCGILPLAAVDENLQFLGARSDYNGIITGPNNGADVVGAALRALKRSPVPWRRCRLANVPASSELGKRLTGASAWKFRACVTYDNRCPRVELAADRDATLAAILNKKSLRRHEKKLARLGGITFRHVEDRDEVRKHLPAFFEQHVARWGRTENPSLFLNPAAREFYGELLNELDPRVELRFGILQVGERPVAYHFGFQTNDTIYWHRPTFDVDLWDYSPGEVLIKKLFEYVRDTRLTRFDFTKGNEPFKHRYANQTAENVTLHLFPPGARGMARCFAARARAVSRRYRAQPAALVRVTGHAGAQ